MDNAKETVYSLDRTLLQFAQISALNKPTKDNLRGLREWLQASDGGSHFQMGSEAFTWKKDYDLLSLGERDIDNDILSQWMYSKVVDLGTRLKNCLHKVS
jgi:hypothetical protein